MRLSSALILAVYLFSFCAQAETCNTPAGWEDVKPVSKTHIIALGEMHGTNEVPDFVGAILCDLVASGIPVRFGIEAARSQGDALDSLVQNEFSEAQAYAAAPAMWDSPDGRSSEAVLELFIDISSWRRTGADIGVFAFDFAPSTFPEDIEVGRHAVMASMVDAAAEDFDGAVLLVAGGYHTPIMRRTNEPMSGSMSNLITARPVASFDMRHRGGTAFVTYSMDGSETITGELTLSGIQGADMADWSISFEPLGVHYRGQFSVGAITASPPAFPAED
ncbi:MAG: hypothetical protein AAF642_08600 [Pseudomonadota bacterium]